MFPHYPWLNSFPFHSFLLSIAFSPFPLLFLLLSPLIYLNHPPGENRSPPQSGTNCFVRFMNPEPNPDKRTLVRTAVLFVFARVTDCNVIKVFIVLLCCSCECRISEALQHIKAVTNMVEGPNGKKCCGHK